MAIDKIQSESIDLADNFAFTGTVTGTPSITNAQQFYLSGSKSFSANTATVIDTAFSALDNTKAATIGSASNITVSSGIFSFATTGIYLIQATMNFYFTGSNESRYVQGNIEVTSNNSSYNVGAQATGQIADVNSGNNDNECLTPSYIVDVDDTSNVKIRLACASTAAGATETQNKSFQIRFIRLSDT